MATLDQRRRAFGKFVKVALADAKARGLTVAEIEKRTGMSSTTFYRWRDGEWSRDPRPTEVRKFCDALEIPYSAAQRTLGWAAEGEPVADPEPPMPPEVRAILRTLNDPSVPKAKKDAIREMLRLIAREHTSSRRAAAG